MVYRKLRAGTAAYLVIGILLHSKSPMAAPQSIAYLSLYYSERAIHKTNTDYVLLVDGRSLAIKSGELNPPQSRVLSGWNEFYKKSENPPESDLQIVIIGTPPNGLRVCLSGRCAKVIQVCPPVNLQPSKPCLPPDLIKDIEKVE